MFKKILNGIKARRINGSSQLLIGSSKNLTDILGIVRDKERYGKKEGITDTLELVRENERYLSQKQLVDKLIEAEILTLSTVITSYLKDGVEDKVGKGIEDLSLLLNSGIANNVIPKELEENLTFIIVNYVKYIEQKKVEIPENLEKWLQYYVDTSMALAKHIRENVLPELTDVNKMTLFS